jgi:hypothetical protein
VDNPARVDKAEKDETVSSDPHDDESREEDRPVDDDLSAGERELLAAFERLSPQGSLQWGFDDAMRRIADPGTESITAPWKGLPDDLWERGRSALIGQRFVGDVAGVMAELLAADSRSVARGVADGRFLAVWDALRYLAARVERLEARVDPLGFEAAEQAVPVPDPTEWVEQLPGWLEVSEQTRPVIVGESGDGGLLDALRRAGLRVRGVEPRGESVWRSIASDKEGSATGGGTDGVEMAEVVDLLAGLPGGAAAGVVLLGCVDRLDLVAKLELLDQSMRVVVPGGAVVVLAADRSVWDEALSVPERDLARGHPLHPKTWELLLHRAGAVEVVSHRARSGTVHAVVGRVRS